MYSTLSLLPQTVVEVSAIEYGLQLHLNQCQLFCVIRHLLKAWEQICCIVSTDCDHLEPPENGSIYFTAGLLGNYTLNATATYIHFCDIGYNLSGSAQRTCMETSEWLPGAPNCSLSITILHCQQKVNKNVCIDQYCLYVMPCTLQYCLFLLVSHYQAYAIWNNRSCLSWLWTTFGTNKWHSVSTKRHTIQCRSLLWLHCWFQDSWKR